MKLSDFKGEEALELLADIIEPMFEILGDDKFKDMVRSGTCDQMQMIKYLLKTHKKPILTILALMDKEDPETYEPNVLTIPLKLLELGNDPDIIKLFTSQGQKKA